MSLRQFTNNEEWENGFGQRAYDRARAAGLSNADISRQLAGSGLKIGARAASNLGGNTDLYQYKAGGNEYAGGFGLKALERARAAGLSDGDIRSKLATSGLSIGDRAAQSLNVNGGNTYFGLRPGSAGSFGGSGGGTYGGRAVLAPRGYGVGEGAYSPVYNVYGGMNDTDALQGILGAPTANFGGTYSDPNFNRDNYIPPKDDPDRPFGGYSEGAGPTSTMNAGQSIGKTGYRYNDPTAKANNATARLKIKNVNV